MIEILWHGRGGQGAFTAARLLGAACSFQDGRYALAFPSFGPERRGAPMRAFTKLDDKPVGDRSAISKADFVIYLDNTLFGEGWESELKPGGKVLVNSQISYDDDRVVSVDADGISAAILGRVIPNTVFLAALSALSEDVDEEDIKEAIRQYMPAKLHAKNIAIVDHVVALLSGETSGKAESLEQSAFGETEQSAASAAAELALSALSDASPEEGRLIPALADADALDHSIYARNTCWTAGHLVSKNAGWRQVRPVIDQETCTKCLICYMDCPDGTIFKVDGANGALAIDYDFCKGCGVCAKSCRFGAISMVSEADVLAAEAAAAEAVEAAETAKAVEGGAC